MDDTTNAQVDGIFVEAVKDAGSTPCKAEAIYLVENHLHQMADRLILRLRDTHGFED